MDILMVLGGGIGNIIQATGSMQRIIEAGHTLDVKVHCNSSTDINIFKINGVRNLYANDQTPQGTYEYQIRGPFTPGKKYNAKNQIKTASYARHYPESKLYDSLLDKIKVGKKNCESRIYIQQKNFDVKDNTVAIFPGSKPSWGMKRWDKFDALSRKFDNVIILGSKKDINSNGDVPWFTKKWEWKEKTQHFVGSLNDNASLISKCKLFIGNDGGISHLAAATGIPTFVIFGPTSIVKNKPNNSNAYAISYNEIKDNQLDCQPCQFGGKGYFKENCNGCPINMKCMRDLTVDDVMSFIKKKVNL